MSSELPKKLMNVLFCIAQGKTPETIAKELGYPISTVRTYIQRIKHKLVTKEEYPELRDGTYTTTAALHIIGRRIFKFDRPRGPSIGDILFEKQKNDRKKVNHFYYHQKTDTANLKSTKQTNGPL